MAVSLRFSFSNMKNEAQQVQMVIDKFTILDDHVKKCGIWYNPYSTWNFNKHKEPKMKNLNESILYI